MAKRNWYGIKGLEFVWHGEWSDPGVIYKGIEVDSVVPENTMWDRWIHDDDGNFIQEREDDEKGFCQYMRDNANEVRELICLAMEPIAMKVVCNFGGIGILKIDDYGESIISGENYGDGFCRIAKAQIRYNSKGDAYFMRQGRREYLNEYMKTGRN